MTTFLELHNLVHPGYPIPTQILDIPEVAKHCAKKMNVSEQVKYICYQCNTSSTGSGERVLRQLHDNKLYWDKEGNLHIRK